MGRWAVWGLVGIFIIAAPVGGFGQGYPAKPIRLLVGFPAGGAVDMTPRILAPALGAALKQPLIIDNRGGAHGNIATELVVNARPDGYTLLVGSSGSLVINPLLYRNLKFAPTRDLAPVAMLASVANVVLVHKSVGVNTLSELIALARSKPGFLNYASPGIGSPAHLATELLKGIAKIDMVHVPYKGGSQVISDMLAGQVHVTVMTATTAAPHVKSGGIKALAVTTGNRSSALPDVPTIREATGLVDCEAMSWHGLMAPVATPRPIIAKLSAAIRAALELKDVRDKLLGQGLEPSWSSPEEFGAYLKSETQKWSRVARDAGVAAQ